MKRTASPTLPDGATQAKFEPPPTCNGEIDTLLISDAADPEMQPVGSLLFYGVYKFLETNLQLICPAVQLIY